MRIPIELIRAIVEKSEDLGVHQLEFTTAGGNSVQANRVRHADKESPWVFFVNPND